MTVATKTDLEMLARGGTVPSDLFAALVADPAALAELQRLCHARDLLEPAKSPRPAGPADVTMHELAQFVEGQCASPAAESFLHANAPQLLPGAGIDDGVTVIDLAEGDTECGPASAP